jgi:hypothetical protein
LSRFALEIQKGREAQNPTAGKVCGVFECKRKSVKVTLGQNVELFDLQRRRLSGLRVRVDRLILECEFQNPA